MDSLLGLLRIRVKRGLNLAVRDVRSSDPYVVVKMGKQIINAPITRSDENHEIEVEGIKETEKAKENCTKPIRKDIPQTSIVSYLVAISLVSMVEMYVPVAPYVLFGSRLLQKLKTRVIRKDVNPEWNEDLTLSISDPNLPIKLTVYDHDTFTKDDKMGDAEFDIKALVEAMRMDLHGLPSGVTVTRVEPSRQNCLAEASCIKCTDRKVSQDLCLRLRNVECGEVELSLHWVDLPATKAL
ncbi:hypothetical protein RHMOL_Rhmol12G0161300 [Rhododendron molle]|uniref:Uncharacterized protein n=1 Tax=Rhododendron molle TaxID=49168 RepID=A0ACC0LKC3_RHOML|nr:hypothetical protein RHMOL_Rhmol12G0161300 [Rhododendron molle]